MAQFITGPQLKQAIADMMRVDILELDPLWDRIAAESATAAYNDIVSALSNRGYTAVEIDTWVRGAEFNRDIGLYWAFVKGAGLHSYDDKWIDKLDRREELESVYITIVTVGVDNFDVRSGQLVNDELPENGGDRFSLDDTW